MEVPELEDLRGNLMFQELELEEMREILGFSERQTYSADSFVFKQDEESHKLFLVEKGLIGVIIQIRPSTQLAIATESRGGILGWSALVPPHVYTASAKCFEQTELLAIEGRKLRELCYQNTGLGVKVMEGLARLIAVRLQKTNLQVLDAMWK